MPTLWNARTPDQTVEQVWFRGVHADVGGGYQERGLSDITLKWMLEKAKEAGLLLRDHAADDLKPDYTARIHNEFKGIYPRLDTAWPRWHPLPPVAGTETDASFGTLDQSVYERDQWIQNQIRREPRFVRPSDDGTPTTISIAVNTVWNATGILMERGAQYRIAARGWVCGGTKEPTDANGYSSQPGLSPVRWLSYWCCLRGPRMRMPDEPHLKLIGLINTPRNWPNKVISLSKYLWYLSGSDPKQIRDMLIPLGNDKIITAENTGAFYCFFNERWREYTKNSGVITLQIARVNDTRA